MTKNEFFTLSFVEKCHFVSTVRQNLYNANTKGERDAAIPTWLIKMVEDFEEKYQFRNFTSLLLGSLLMMKNFEDTEEIVCLLDEINDNQLHLSIIELDRLINLSRNRLTEESNDDEYN